jgi:hypothetical protein
MSQICYWVHNAATCVEGAGRSSGYRSWFAFSKSRLRILARRPASEIKYYMVFFRQFWIRRRRDCFTEGKLSIPRKRSRKICLLAYVTNRPRPVFLNSEDSRAPFGTLAFYQRAPFHLYHRQIASCLTKIVCNRRYTSTPPHVGLARR